MLNRLMWKATRLGHQPVQFLLKGLQRHLKGHFLHSFVAPAQVYHRRHKVFPVQADAVYRPHVLQGTADDLSFQDVSEQFLLDGVPMLQHELVHFFRVLPPGPPVLNELVQPQPHPGHILGVHRLEHVIHRAVGQRLLGVGEFFVAADNHGKGPFGPLGQPAHQLQSVHIGHGDVQ